MATSILDALRNAESNFKRVNGLAEIVGKHQLHSAIILLEKGYGVDAEITQLLKEYDEVEEVPEKAK